MPRLSLIPTRLSAASTPRVAAGRPRTTGSADKNDNGELDEGEDLNHNEELDRDTGIFAVLLDPNSINLVLDVDPFEQGAGEVGFTVTVPDPTSAGTGRIAAVDGRFGVRNGNFCDPVRVDIPPNTPPRVSDVLI
jgi:hypothetical protein